MFSGYKLYDTASSIPYRNPIDSFEVMRECHAYNIGSRAKKSNEFWWRDACFLLFFFCTNFSYRRSRKLIQFIQYLDAARKKKRNSNSQQHCLLFRKWCLLNNNQSFLQRQHQKQKKENICFTHQTSNRNHQQSSNVSW